MRCARPSDRGSGTTARTGPTWSMLWRSQRQRRTTPRPRSAAEFFRAVGTASVHFGGTPHHARDEETTMPRRNDAHPSAERTATARPRQRLISTLAAVVPALLAGVVIGGCAPGEAETAGGDPTGSAEWQRFTAQGGDTTAATSSALVGTAP